MSNAKHDQNNRPAATASSSSDGITIVPLVSRITDHRLLVNDNTTGSDNGNNQGVAILDENSVPVFTAVSSVDLNTIIELYANPVSHALLINSQ